MFFEKQYLTLLYVAFLASGACAAHSYPKVIDQELFLKDNGRSFQISSHSLNDGDAWHVGAGEKKVLADVNGPCIVRNVWFTCSGLPETGEEYLRNLIIRMYWDNEKTPSVEVPFGDFFGNGFSRRVNWHSEYLGVTSGGFYSYFPMPFRKHARIEIENTSGKAMLVFFHILCQRYDRLPENTLYFHSQWRRENPTIHGKNYTILDAAGEGYFAGVFLFMQAYDKGDKWNFLEGDEFMYVDGEKDASIKGTGGEDYFQGGWYFIDGTFNAPYHGLVLKDPDTIRASCYRFHLLDRVNFNSSIHVEIEHGNRPGNDAKADFSSVAYWYQSEPHKAFEPLNPDRKPTITLPAYIFPGAIEWEGTPETQPIYMSTYQNDWSNNMAGVFVGKIGQSSQNKFSVPSDGRYLVGVNLIANDCGAIAQISIDGNDIGSPIDTYSKDAKDYYLLNNNKAMGLKQIGKLQLREGEHIAKITLVGRNEKAKGCELMVDCITIQKENTK
jgi:hypothetical protein